MMALKFEIEKRFEKSRLGKIITSRGVVETPNFMPVGSKGAVKGISVPLLKEAGAQIILCNTFHLYLRPSSKTIEKLGGLHKFSGWDGPILTDSGGFQAFSLAPLKKITEEGIKFSSPTDGQKINLTPELAITIQEELDVDIAMVLDHLPSGKSTKKEQEIAVKRTTRWAERCKKALKNSNISLFGIVQGGIFEDLREISATELREIGFDGYAAGGFCVGEDKEGFKRVAQYTAKLLPEDKPRYLMGIGKPQDLVDGVLWGYDLFDCVLPTRNARNGQLFTSKGKITIKRAEYKEDSSSLDSECKCYTCRNLTKAYLNHLFRVNDPTYVLLATIHNITFYLNLMKQLREAIKSEKLEEICQKIKDFYPD
ncbi:MAG: tRNA guanosine(34) transglycosylase Tgt [Thermoanaerobaculaceae bacterium]|nr:tRNA guanosine(34) transglycosylase Tgt [Thermoanaerobaculaceae bacterium]